MKSADTYEPRYSWDYFDEKYPHHSDKVGVGRTLAVGSFLRLRMQQNFWSQTSDHLIVYVDAECCHLAIPAKTLGGTNGLLAWLQNRAEPPSRLWHDIIFWLGRLEDGVWTWFEDDSPEAYAHLPWLKEESYRMVAEVMNS